MSVESYPRLTTPDPGPTALRGSLAPEATRSPGFTSTVGGGGGLTDGKTPEVVSAAQRYIEAAQRLMGEVDSVPYTVRMRVEDSGKKDAPAILVSSPTTDEIDLRHLLQPGGKVLRQRPHDADGDVEATILRGPYVTTVGPYKGEYRIGMEVEGFGAKNVLIKDLIASPNPENGKSWRLIVPESLPGAPRTM